jgi:predicted protein tyrosine phosphatase
MKLLFVCSRNRRRSPTAETHFSAYPGVEALSAGTSPDAETPISADLIEWADIIFVMEATHRKRLVTAFRSQLRQKRLIVLGIRDQYSTMDPELVRLLEAKVNPHLKCGAIVPD